MQETSGTKTFQLNGVVFFGRTMAEYQQMFNLEAAALKQLRILDCPSGPASFVAESTQLGAQTTGVDTVYSMSQDELAAKAHNDISSCLSKIGISPTLFAWETEEELAAFKREKQIACQRFIADMSDGFAEKRYIHATLPTLPFADKSFDLVLSSYLLFIYSDISQGGILADSPFDYQFHLQSLLELARVSAGQVKVYPLKGHNAVKSGYLDDIRADLHNRGIKTQLEPVGYRDITGANELLRLDVN